MRTTLLSALLALPLLAGEKPNIIFLLTDDQRPDTIAALGNANIRTPNLDRIARDGMVFRNAYCFGAAQGAVCVPSRAQILTGVNLFHLKGGLRTVEKAGPEEYSATFARTMKSAGYATLRTGKEGSTPAKLYREFDREITITRAPTCAAQHADNAIAFLKENAGKRPVFIYVEFATPHDPQPAPPEYYELYNSRQLPEPAAFLPLHPFNNGEMAIRDEQTLPWPRTRESVNGKIARYYASITYTDEQIGRVLRAVDDAGQRENTIIVFASDNGLSLGEHGLLGKQNLYEFGGMHVPMIFAGPGIQHGETKALAYLFDIFPTVCGLSGVAAPAGLDGRSLAGLLGGGTEPVRDHVITAYGSVQRAIRDDRWKLIVYPEINKTQLFDLQSDAHEERDLAADPAQAGRVQAMTARLQKELAEFHDPFPLSVENPRPVAWAPPVAARKAERAGESRRK